MPGCSTEEKGKQDEAPNATIKEENGSPRRKQDETREGKGDDLGRKEGKGDVNQQHAVGSDLAKGDHALRPKVDGHEKQPQQQHQVATPEQAVGRGSIPIQPYGYPPYPYYPPLPGYASAPAQPPQPRSQDSYNMMTGTSNPYSYTDVSNLGDPTPDTRRNRGGVTEPFPEKLHRMLDCVERERMTDVVSFFSHGRAFAIHKPRLFVQEIMPRFFRQTRLTSFQRQLNLYGFRRISQGPDNGGYYHELFLKGRPGLCVNMKRTKVKGTAKLKRDPDSEPNFYSYPPLPSQGQTTTPAPRAASGQSNISPAPPPPHASYTYPPAHYVYPPMPNAPYPASQAPVYPYPQYYGYQWYPPPPPPHSSHNGTPQASPSKENSTPSAPPPASKSDTPVSTNSTLENTTSVTV